MLIAGKEYRRGLMREGNLCWLSGAVRRKFNLRRNQAQTSVTQWDKEYNPR